MSWIVLICLGIGGLIRLRMNYVVDKLNERSQEDLDLSDVYHAPETQDTKMLPAAIDVEAEVIDEPDHESDEHATPENPGVV